MKKRNKKIIAKTGIGLAAAAIATSAGAYFLYGKDGDKNRKKIKGWMLKAKGEILQELEHMKNVDEKTYHELINTAASRYKILKNVNNKELFILAKELKDHWQHIKKASMAKPKKKVVPSAKLRASKKKATKKTTKKK
ncbi:hypothetical protein KJ671_02760 [Patescibacteria group bacterium]|nr:hypothetical protein [Patescibacteria group bacterium]